MSYHQNCTRRAWPTRYGSCRSRCSKSWMGQPICFSRTSRIGYERPVSRCKQVEKIKPQDYFNIFPGRPPSRPPRYSRPAETSPVETRAIEPLQVPVSYPTYRIRSGSTSTSRNQYNDYTNNNNKRPLNSLVDKCNCIHQSTETENESPIQKENLEVIFKYKKKEMLDEENNIPCERCCTNKKIIDSMDFNSKDDGNVTTTRFKKREVLKNEVKPNTVEVGEDEDVLVSESMTEFCQKYKSRPQTASPTRRKRKTKDNETEYQEHIIKRKEKRNKTIQAGKFDPHKISISKQPFEELTRPKTPKRSNAKCPPCENTSLQCILNRYLTKCDPSKKLKIKDDTSRAFKRKESDKSINSKKTTSCSKRCHFPCSKLKVPSKEKVRKTSIMRIKSSVSIKDQSYGFPHQKTRRTSKFTSSQKTEDNYMNDENGKKSVDWCIKLLEKERNKRKMDSTTSKRNDYLDEIEEQNSTKKISVESIKQTSSFISITSNQVVNKTSVSNSRPSEERLLSKCFSESSFRSRSKLKRSSRPTTAPEELGCGNNESCSCGRASAGYCYQSCKYEDSCYHCPRLSERKAKEMAEKMARERRLNPRPLNLGGPKLFTKEQMRIIPPRHRQCFGYESVKVKSKGQKRKSRHTSVSDREPPKSAPPQVSTEDYLRQMSQYHQQKSEHLEHVMREQLGHYRRIMQWKYEQKLTQLKEYMEQEQVELAKSYERKHELLQSQVQQLCQKLQEMQPSFSFEDQHKCPEMCGLTKPEEPVVSSSSSSSVTSSLELAQQNVTDIEERLARVRQENQALASQLTQLRNDQTRLLSEAQRAEAHAQRQQQELRNHHKSLCKKFENTIAATRKDSTSCDYNCDYDCRN